MITMHKNHLNIYWQNSLYKTWILVFKNELDGDLPPWAEGVSYTERKDKEKVIKEGELNDNREDIKRWFP